jgi:hypothetical protein
MHTRGLRIFTLVFVVFGSTQLQYVYMQRLSVHPTNEWTSEDKKIINHRGL